MANKKSSIKKLSDLQSSSDLMAQLLAKSGKKVGSFQVGQKVTGKVLEINSKSLVLDIGAKAEGLVSDREFEAAASFINDLKIGQTIEATVTSPENSNGQVHLSLKQAAQSSGWKLLQEAMKSGVAVDIYVIEANRGGLTVSVSGIESFIPMSQVGQKYAKNPQAAIGKILKAKVQEVDLEGERVIFSEKAVSEAESLEKQQQALKNVKKGDRFLGKVVGLVPFGAFVQIQIEDPSATSGQVMELEGLVHLSELSWERVSDSSQVLQVGQEVQVAVIGREPNRLALSIKQTQEDPWEKVLEGIDVDTKLKGKVLRTGDFGAYIEIKPGIEAQIKLNKIPDGVSIREGDLVDVMVESIDKRRHQITVGFVLTAKPIGYK